MKDIFEELKSDNYIDATVSRQFSPLKVSILWKGVYDFMDEFGINYKHKNELIISEELGKETLYNPKTTDKFGNLLSDLIKDEKKSIEFYKKAYEICSLLVLKARQTNIENFSRLSDKELVKLFEECNLCLKKYAPLTFLGMVADIFTATILPNILKKYDLDIGIIFSEKKAESISVSNEWAKMEDCYINMPEEKIDLSTLNLSSEDYSTVKFLREMTFFRSYRTDAMRKYFHLTQPLLKEIGKRFSLTLEEVSCFLDAELIDLLKGKIIDLKSIKARTKGFILYFDGNKFYISAKQEDINLVKSKFSKDTSKKVKGRCAFPGIAFGVVKVIETPKELSKLQEENILVAKTTSPVFTTYFGKVKAIVTDEGGLTSHAAIVSREMRIPCIIATGNATRVLKDGDKVKVDAAKGEVTVL